MLLRVNLVIICFEVKNASFKISCNIFVNSSFPVGLYRLYNNIYQPGGL